MSASLVGSEMCIRDSTSSNGGFSILAAVDIALRQSPLPSPPLLGAHAVSYTHLTLPTICSV
eukprot:15157486-Alexandrium_andersonii.AAC.1